MHAGGARLEEEVEHVRVRLLDLVEQDEAVRRAAHRLGELPALVVADVPRRRPRQPAHRVRLHVLAHVEPHHGVLRAVVRRGDRLRELGLAHARRPGEDEARDGAARVAQPQPRAAQRAAHRADGAALADDSLAQRRRHVA